MLLLFRKLGKRNFGTMRNQVLHRNWTQALRCNLIFSASLRDPGTPEISETTSNYFTRRLGKLVPAYPSEKEDRGVDCMQLTL